jgi:hypothetical protein
MKKALLIVSLLGLTILVLGAAGLVYAQTDTPQDPDGLFGFGKFGRRGAIGQRMGFDVTDRPFHEYMFPAIAEALGLTEAELQERLDAGDTHWQIIEDQGLSDLTLAEFRDLMFDTVKNAINLALDDDFLTADQAQQMLDRADLAYEDGFGPGFMGHRGRGMGGRITGFGPGEAVGPIDEYMIPALAEALGLSPETLNERIESGETIRDIVGESELSSEEIQALMQDVHEQALEAAVAAGAITQKQADLMSERMGGRLGGFGGDSRPFGGCR